MAGHSETAASDSALAHAHGLPHSHAGAYVSVPHRHGDAAAVNIPAMSLLRMSLAVRLASAVVLSAVIWAVIHWATL